YQPLGELAVGRLEVDDHRLRALELVGNLLCVVEALWGDHVHGGDAGAAAVPRRGPAATATARRGLLGGVVHRTDPAATGRGLVVAEDVVDVVLAATAPRRHAADGLARRHGSLVERHLAARVALVVIALLDVIALNEAEVLERASP